MVSDFSALNIKRTTFTRWKGLHFAEKELCNESCGKIF
jgi:hypothetical protein